MLWATLADWTAHFGFLPSPTTPPFGTVGEKGNYGLGAPRLGGWMADCSIPEFLCSAIFDCNCCRLSLQFLFAAGFCFPDFCPIPSPSSCPATGRPLLRQFCCAVCSAVCLLAASHCRACQHNFCTLLLLLLVFLLWLFLLLLLLATTTASSQESCISEILSMPMPMPFPCLFPSKN